MCSFLARWVRSGARRLRSEGRDLSVPGAALSEKEELAECQDGEENAGPACAGRGECCVEQTQALTVRRL